MELEYRLVTPDDAAQYRELRLEALQNAPDAFGASYEDEAPLTLADFAQRLERGITVGCFDGPTLIGTAKFFLPYPGAIRLGHKGQVVAVYVKPEYRGSGIGTTLMSFIEHQVPDGITQILLTVSSANPDAKRFYKRLGYAEWGREPRAMILDGRALDEIHMIKFINETRE